MSGKHDKAAADEQAVNLLRTGPIAIRGLGRGVKDVLRPGRSSRHRAFIDEDGQEPAAASAASAAADPTPVQWMLSSGPTLTESGPTSALSDAPATQAQVQADPSFRTFDDVAQTEGPDGPEEDRVDDVSADDPAPRTHDAQAAPSDDPHAQAEAAFADRSPSSDSGSEESPESTADQDRPAEASAAEPDGPEPGGGEETPVTDGREDRWRDEDEQPGDRAEQWPGAGAGAGGAEAREGDGVDDATAAEAADGDPFGGLFAEHGSDSVNDDGVDPGRSEARTEVTGAAEHDAEWPSETVEQDLSRDEEAPEAFAERSEVADVEQSIGAAEAPVDRPDLLETAADEPAEPAEPADAPHDDDAPSDGYPEAPAADGTSEVDHVAASSREEPLGDGFTPAESGADDRGPESGTDGETASAAEPLEGHPSEDQLEDAVDSGAFAGQEELSADAAAMTTVSDDSPEAIAADASPLDEVSEDAGRWEEPGVDEAPVDETRVDEAAVVDRPDEWAPVAHVPADDAAAGEAPVDEVRADETPDTEGPDDGVPVDRTPVDEAPFDDASADETSVERAPVDEASGDGSESDLRSADETVGRPWSFGDSPAGEPATDDPPSVDAPVDEASDVDPSGAHAHVDDAGTFGASDVGTPGDGASTDGSSGGDAPVHDAPVDDAPVDEDSTPGATMGETSADVVASDEQPADDTPSDDTPVDETTVDETPSDAASAGEAPAPESPTGEESVEVRSGADEAPGPDESGSDGVEPPAVVAVPPRPAAVRTARPSVAPSRPPRRARRMRDRVGREAIGIAVLVVLALICGGLITAVVLKTQRDAAIAAQEAKDYTPPPLATPEPAATGPVVAVIGDGIVTDAASGVTTAQQWTTLLGSSLSGTVDADAASGMGYAAKSSSGDTFVQAASKVPSNADVVVFFGGAADSKIAPLSLVKAVSDALSAASTQAPDAKLIVVGPAITAGISDGDLTAIRNSLRGAARIARATWIDPIESSWLPSTSQDASSPTALTAADEKAIASRMQDAVTKALG